MRRRFAQSIVVVNGILRSVLLRELLIAGLTPLSIVHIIARQHNDARFSGFRELHGRLLRDRQHRIRTKFSCEFYSMHNRTLVPPIVWVNAIGILNEALRRVTAM